MKILEINKPAKLLAKANEIVPIRAMINKYPITFFGPNLSNNIPVGICMSENPRKYPPAKSPRFAALNLNSVERAGVNVAVIDLSKFDIKKPKANTEKIRILLFILLIIYIFYEITVLL